MNGLVTCYDCGNIKVVKLNFDSTKAGEIVMLPCGKCKSKNGAWTIHYALAVCCGGILLVWEDQTL